LIAYFVEENYIANFTISVTLFLLSCTVLPKPYSLFNFVFFIYSQLYSIAKFVKVLDCTIDIPMRKLPYLLKSAIHPIEPTFTMQSPIDDISFSPQGPNDRGRFLIYCTGRVPLTPLTCFMTVRKLVFSFFATILIPLISSASERNIALKLIGDVVWIK